MSHGLTRQQEWEVQRKRGEVKSSNSFPNHLFKIDRYKLIKLLMETQDKLRESNDKCLQIGKDLKIVKTMFSI